MKIAFLLAVVVVAAVIFYQCSDPIDLDTRRSELLEFNERMRTAHLEGDAETILAGLAYPYVKVRNGEVTHPTREENAERYQNYMSTMNVTVWDDLQDPIFTISADGSLATGVYNKQLVMASVDAPEGTEPYEGIFAWQSTYRYTDDGWKMIGDVTTSVPAEE
jgi:hypothetical protein